MPVDPRDREAAIAAAEERCPRCATPREPNQEYCLECGLRLPAVTGGVASLRRRWMQRLGWYPGDWVWISLVTLLVAAAGAAAAIALTDDDSADGSTTVVISTSVPLTTAPPRTTTRRSTLPTAPEPTLPTKTTTAPRPTTTAPRPAPATPGRTVWPKARNGYTIVLISYPSQGGRAAALATAGRAANAGLPEVGVLNSSNFSSLHPGYAVVFSGIYSSRTDAEAALSSARASGFGGAYVREVSK